MAVTVAGPELVRVLLVEDDPADMELIQAELERSGIEYTCDCADTLEEVRSLLDRTRYDLVLTDYRLRGWDGMAVLAELQARGRDTPLVLVSGTIGEERAVECLREGATDCVLKDNLGRLPHVVRRALTEARERRERAAADELVRRLSVAVDQSPAAIYMTDTMGTIEYVNRRFSTITGYTEDEALGATPRIMRSGKTPVSVYEEMWRTIIAGNVWRGELMNRRRNGDIYWAHASISPMRGEDGAVTHFVAVQEDVSERRWAEDAVREREERLGQIAENIHEVFYVVDAEYRETLFISPAYEDVWGRTCRSLYENPRSFLDGIHPDDREAVIGNINRLKAGEEAEAIEFRVVRPDGEERWVRSHSSGVRDTDGAVYRIAGAAIDITPRRHAEDRLRESEERFRTLTEASFDAIIVSVKGMIREVNPGFEVLLGYAPEEAVGRPALDFVAEDSRAEVQRHIEERIEGTYEVVLVRKDGRRTICEVTGKNHRVQGQAGRVTALRDITEKQALEQQLRQAQKLEAVGRLAGGVAHDFNNVLTVILTEVQLLELTEEVQRSETLAEALHEIEAAGQRAAGLTRQLLTFSRRAVVELEIVDPREVARGLHKMLGRLIGEDLALDVAFADDVGNVRIDPGQLEQVIVNLVVNARDAMPRGGELHIEIANVTLDAEYATAHPDATPGRHVMIAVSDTGVGIPAEVRERLFEPFFTTKPEGIGTGLGLATSYGIVRDRAGHISVYSEVGVGTTMKVYLPVADEPELPDRGGVAEEVPDVPMSGTVLVVEDDEAVRRNAVRALERVGLRVLSASNGSAALALIDEHGDKVDLLFADVVMPGLSGPELVARAKERLPYLKTLYSTGYTADMALRHRLLDHMDEVLPKPYTPEELYRKVRGVMGA